MKHETVGQHLKRARESLDLSPDRLSEKIFKEYGFKVSPSTIQATEIDRSPNTGRKTLEYICLGLGLNPVLVFNMGLENPLDLDSNIEFARLASLYKEVRKPKKPFIDFLKEILTEQMERASERRRR